jgi:glycosyltransferase 2 family protein
MSLTTKYRMHPMTAWLGPAEPAQKRFFMNLRATLRVVLACAIVTTLVTWISPEEVFKRFAAIPLSAALAGLAGALFEQWLSAVRLRLLANSQRLALTGVEAFFISISAVFYGLFLPGGSATGWAVRLLRLARGKSNTGAALFVLGCDRVLATASLAVIGVIADLLLRGPASVAVSAGLFAVALGMTLLAVFLLVPSFRVVLAPVQRIRFARWFGKLVSNREGMETGPQYRIAVTALFLSLCGHLVSIAVWVLLARSVGIDINVVVIAWVRTTAMVVALLPATVGGLGLRESAVIYLLASFGVSGADALSLSLAVFAVTVLAVGIVGGGAEVWYLLIHRQLRPINTDNSSSN